MSEQALKAPTSGASSTTGTAVTGTFPVLTGGKADPNAGKDLPTVKVERPDLVKLAQELNTVSRSIGRDLRFQVDLNRGNAVLQVIDSETGEIIRQIPHEKALSTVRDNGTTTIRLFDAVV